MSLSEIMFLIIVMLIYKNKYYVLSNSLSVNAIKNMYPKIHVNLFHPPITSYKSFVNLQFRDFVFNLFSFY